MDDDQLPAVVLDCGTCATRAGFAGAEAPRFDAPTVVGRQTRVFMMCMGSRDHFVCNEAISKRGLLSLTYPVRNGEIQSFDDMERIWRHVFYYALRAAPEEVGAARRRQPAHIATHSFPPSATNASRRNAQYGA